MSGALFSEKEDRPAGVLLVSPHAEGSAPLTITDLDELLGFVVRAKDYHRPWWKGAGW